MNDAPADYSHTAYAFRASTLRITPLDEHGTPQHTWAHTFTYGHPVDLTVLHRTPLPPITSGPITHLSYDRTTLHAAVTARDNLHAAQSRAEELAPLTYALWQRRRHGSAVEAWADSPDGHWWYRLIPRWHVHPTDEWPDPRTPDTVYAHARLDYNPAFTQADPQPYPDPGQLCREHFFVTAGTTTPPPEAGLPNPLAWPAPHPARSDT